MNALQLRALDLLDQHLYGNLSKAAKKEALQGINQAYGELSFRKKPVTFFDSDNFVAQVGMLGDVEFERKYPKLGITSYASPDELIDKIQNKEYFLQDRFGQGGNGDPEGNFSRIKVLKQYANEPKPAREMIQMSRAFQDYSQSPEGARLYQNTPISEHRAKAYLKQGFQDIPVYDIDYDKIINKQFIDNRPYSNQDIVNQLYVFGDTQRFGEMAAQMLYEQRLNNIGANLQLPMNDVIAKAKIPASTYYEPVQQRYGWDEMPF